jgi:hypothetical protein
MTLLNAEVIKDYKGKPAIRIYFDFTSNSDENISAMFSTMTTAFQKGVELDTAMVLDSNEFVSNYQKNIKKGVTLRCAVTFLLTDSVSPVTLEALAFPSFDSSNKLVREYSIK